MIFIANLLHFIKKNNLHYNVVDNQGNTYTSQNDWFDKYTIMQAYENDNGLFVREPDDLPNNFEITKAIINGDEKKLDDITPMVNDKFAKDYFVVRTGVGFLEIFPKDVNKGNAIKILAKDLNLDLSEVMAMGDRDNDIPNVKNSCKGIAMEK